MRALNSFAHWPTSAQQQPPLALQDSPAGSAAAPALSAPAGGPETAEGEPSTAWWPLAAPVLAAGRVFTTMAELGWCGYILVFFAAWGLFQVWLTMRTAASLVLFLSGSALRVLRLGRRIVLWFLGACVFVLSFGRLRAQQADVKGTAVDNVRPARRAVDHCEALPPTQMVAPARPEPPSVPGGLPAPGPAVDIWALTGAVEESPRIRSGKYRGQPYEVLLQDEVYSAHVRRVQVRGDARTGVLAMCAYLDAVEAHHTATRFGLKAAEAHLAAVRAGSKA